MTQLDRYIEFGTLKAFVIVVGGLSGLLSLLVFVEQLSYVGQGHYHLLDALAYVLLTWPSRLSQSAPVSMLLASLLALGALGANSELTAMRSLGISELRIAGAILKIAVPILVLLFLNAEFVIPPAEQLAEAQRTSKLSSTAPVLGGESFWAQNGNQFLNVQEFGYGNAPKNVDIYDFSPDGALRRFIHADHAVIKPDGTWLLTGVVSKRIQASQFQTERLNSLPWHSFLPLQQARLLVLPPESMPPIGLYHYVRSLTKRHQPAARYEQELWAQVSIPISMVAMILIAIPFVFGSPRSQNTGRQITIGATIGLVFTLIQQIIAHLDLLLDLNPALAELAPSLLLMALAAYLFPSRTSIARALHSTVFMLSRNRA